MKKEIRQFSQSIQRRKEGCSVLQNKKEQMVSEMLSYRCPRYDRWPNIGLYRDQVMEELNQYLAPFFPIGDEPVTPAMVNNYVKLRLIAPPVKKRYNREQLAQLYCICLLKQVFSIAEIRALLEIQTRTYPFPVAYDYFCIELENALQSTFSTRDFSKPSMAQRVTEESELVRSAALCLAHQVFTIKFIEADYLSLQELEQSGTKPECEPTPIIR